MTTDFKFALEKQLGFDLHEQQTMAVHQIVDSHVNLSRNHFLRAGARAGKTVILNTFLAQCHGNYDGLFITAQNRELAMQEFELLNRTIPINYFSLRDNSNSLMTLLKHEHPLIIVHEPYYLNRMRVQDLLNRFHTVLMVGTDRRLTDEMHEFENVHVDAYSVWDLNPTMTTPTRMTRTQITDVLNHPWDFGVHDSRTISRGDILHCATMKGLSRVDIAPRNGSSS